MLPREVISPNASYYLPILLPSQQGRTYSFTAAWDGVNQQITQFIIPPNTPPLTINDWISADRHKRYAEFLGVDRSVDPTRFGGTLINSAYWPMPKAVDDILVLFQREGTNIDTILTGDPSPYLEVLLGYIYEPNLAPDEYGFLTLNTWKLLVDDNDNILHLVCNMPGFNGKLDTRGTL